MKKANQAKDTRQKPVSASAINEALLDAQIYYETILDRVTHVTEDIRDEAESLATEEGRDHLLATLLEYPGLDIEMLPVVIPSPDDPHFQQTLQGAIDRMRKRYNAMTRVVNHLHGNAMMHAEKDRLTHAALVNKKLAEQLIEIKKHIKK